MRFVPKNGRNTSSQLAFHAAFSVLNNFITRPTMSCFKYRKMFQEKTKQKQNALRQLSNTKTLKETYRIRTKRILFVLLFSQSVSFQSLFASAVNECREATMDIDTINTKRSSKQTSTNFFNLKIIPSPASRLHKTFGAILEEPKKQLRQSPN